ncbi:hypothetical protein TeGR_g10734 [Tetraparma gracilis]|uniref:EF-hand domain-containing protein n=1 Tax=Tetraparma gracilis TaxID=2962635 RepID=A0ABQ6MA96_9STRA|nr:hypothetical protein TeGR_g10734 [Tetraparma gracilis]
MLSSLRLVARLGPPRLSLQARLSSSKVQSAFEAYRLANFSQTLGSRFAKQVVSAADKDGDGVLAKEEIMAVCGNIGQGSGLSDGDVEEFIKEVAEGGELSSDELITILTNTARSSMGEPK